MRQVAVVAGVLLAVSVGTACAATDPSTVLNAFRAASGGKAWDGKAVMKTVSKITGQGLTGTDTSVIDLRHGYSTDHYTLGPASGAQGFDGKTPWQQGPDGSVNLQQGGDALPLAIDQSTRTPTCGGVPISAALG